MGEWTAGLAAFGLYFLYDWNRVYRKNGWMKPFFAAGSLLLAWVGLRLILSAWASGQRLWLTPAVLFLAGLIHTLFFALPFDDTYRRRRTGTRSAGQERTAAAATPESGGFSAALSAWAWPAGDGSGCFCAWDSRP